MGLYLISLKYLSKSLPSHRAKLKIKSSLVKTLNFFVKNYEIYNQSTYKVLKQVNLKERKNQYVFALKSYCILSFCITRVNTLT